MDRTGEFSLILYFVKTPAKPPITYLNVVLLLNAGPRARRLSGPGSPEGDAAPGVGSGLVLADRVHGAPTQSERRPVALDRGGQGQTEPGAAGGRRSLRQPGMMIEREPQLVAY